MSQQPLEIYLKLLRDAEQKGVEIYVGGGMALYLRDMWPPDGERSEHYTSIQPENRSTKDLDSFLPKSVMTLPNPTQLEKLRDIITAHGFHPVEHAKYWQWELELGEIGAIIDLLTPINNEESKDPKNVRRVASKNSTGIHARKTPEAEGIDIHPVPLTSPQNQTVNILSSYNLIILKLHACYDHLGLGEKRDPSEQQAQKHAFDIFRTIVDMRDIDWDNAKLHYEQHKSEAYLAKACKIRQDIFSTEEDRGTLALREHSSYQREWDDVIQNILDDLKELFPIT